MADDTEQRLRNEVAELEQLTGKMSRILTETVNALKGDPGPTRLWSWHDLPDEAKKLRRELEILKGTMRGPDPPEVSDNRSWS